MKKQISFMVASLLAFVLFLGVASAALTVTGIPASLSQTDSSFDITIASNTNETVTLNLDDLIQGIENINFNLNKTSLVLNNSNETVKVSYIVSSGFEFDVRKTYTGTLELNGTFTGEKNKTLTFVETKFCEFGEKGDLEITQIGINNLGSGDDNEWEFLDQIEVEVSVENTNQDDSISSVEAEIMILNEAGKDVTNDFFEDSDDKILDYGKIKYDTEETELVLLKISPELEEGKYHVYVKAYKNGYEEDQCTEESEDLDQNDVYAEIEVLVGDKEVGIDNFDYPTTIACGTSMTVSFDFYNFDLADKEEDMRVSLYNYALGIDKYSDKFDLRKGKDKKVYFTVEIPNDVESGIYRMNVHYEYDYDADEDKYDENDLADEYFDLVVEGNCYVDLTPVISAEMVSENAIEGNELIIKTTISNDDATAMFGIAAEGYEDWAELIEISPQFSNINLNESQEFIFKFNLKEESMGEQTFNVVVTSGGNIVSTQSVAVTVEEGSFNLSSLVEGWNWTTIGIILLNLILVVAIILVARNVLKRR